MSKHTNRRNFLSTLGLTAVGTTTLLHLMASISNAGPFLEFVELDTYQEVPGVFDNHIEFKDGKLQVPESPGWA